MFAQRMVEEGLEVALQKTVDILLRVLIKKNNGVLQIGANPCIFNRE